MHYCNEENRAAFQQRVQTGYRDGSIVKIPAGRLPQIFMVNENRSGNCRNEYQMARYAEERSRLRQGVCDHRQDEKR